MVYVRNIVYTIHTDKMLTVFSQGTYDAVWLSIYIYCPTTVTTYNKRINS